MTQTKTPTKISTKTQSKPKPESLAPKPAQPQPQPQPQAFHHAVPEVSDELKLILTTLTEKQVKNLVLLDVSKLVSYTDFLVIGSGNSSTHVQSLADACAAILKKPGIGGVRLESDPSATWMLIDGGDFVLHLFQPEARKFYNLDDLWLDARRVEVA